MNNSVAALCRALSASLRDDVLPKLDDSFAQGQLAATMYVLNNLERQAAWSPELLARHASQAEEGIAQTQAAITKLGLEAPTPPTLFEDRTAGTIVGDEARRDAANAGICALFDWFAGMEEKAAMTTELRVLEKRLLEQAAELVQEERLLVAPSMMREMSGG